MVSTQLGERQCVATAGTDHPIGKVARDHMAAGVYDSIRPPFIEPQNFTWRNKVSHSVLSSRCTTSSKCCCRRTTYMRFAMVWTTATVRLSGLIAKQQHCLHNCTSELARHPTLSQHLMVAQEVCGTRSCIHGEAAANSDR